MAFANHTLCPYIYGKGGSTAAAKALGAFFAKGSISGLDIATIGDSRHTSPTGRGIAPIAALNELFSHITPTGFQEILPWQPQTSSGGGSPPGGYAVIMNTNGVGSVAFNTTATGNKLPGNFTYYRPGTGGGGDMKLYTPDAVNCVRSLASHAGGAKFFDVTQPVYIDLLVVNDLGAVDPANALVVDFRANANTTLSWGGTLLGSAVVPITELNQAGLKCVKYTVGPFTPNGSPYYATNIKLNAALVGANNMGVIASRIRIGNGRGIAFTPMGIGGATVSSLLTNADIAGAGSMFNAGVAMATLNPSAFMILCGQNDAGAAVTMANMKIAVANTINTMRGTGWVNNDIPFIIVNNPQNGGLGTTASSLESTYVQAHTELCDELSNVYFINIRKYLEDKFAWNDITGPQGLTSLGVLPSPLVNTGEWEIGSSYTADVSVVNTDGTNGVALVTNTPVGTFVPDEVVSQATSGATGLFISEVSGTVFLRQTSAADFNGTNALTGGTSGATRAVSAVRGDGLYNREFSYGAGADQPQDIIPRRYWVCKTSHTGIWNRRPASISRDTYGHLHWNQIYPYYDPADPAHWHALGSLAYATGINEIIMGAAFGGGNLFGNSNKGIFKMASWKPVRTYVFNPTSTTGFANVAIAAPVKAGESSPKPLKVLIWVKGDDVTIKFGPSSQAVASNTEASNQLVDGNVTYPDGICIPIELDPSQNNVSMANIVATSGVKVRLTIFEGTA